MDGLVKSDTNKKFEPLWSELYKFIVNDLFLDIYVGAKKKKLLIMNIFICDRNGKR